MQISVNKRISKGTGNINTHYHVNGVVKYSYARSVALCLETLHLSTVLRQKRCHNQDCKKIGVSIISFSVYSYIIC